MFKAGKAWKPSEHIGAGVKAAANWATQQNEKSRREFLQKDLEKKIIFIKGCTCNAKLNQQSLGEGQGGRKAG